MKRQGVQVFAVRLLATFGFAGQKRDNGTGVWAFSAYQLKGWVGEVGIAFGDDAGLGSRSGAGDESMGLLWLNVCFSQEATITDMNIEHIALTYIRKEVYSFSQIPPPLGLAFLPV